MDSGVGKTMFTIRQQETATFFCPLFFCLGLLKSY